MDANSSRRSNCDEPAPPGTSPPPLPPPPTPPPPSKGVENAKKRLRAFSIQKKTTPLSPIVPKPISTGTTTVLIGKLSGVKPTPKIEEDPLKKQPKPPKPGATRKFIQESYCEQRRRTLSEIEDMKRKMELIDLGIPLGLICPSSSDEKAMPTKAMPPIKTFLDPAKVDELIREAKKAKVEGREFKFDYQKILPDYDNPFQRKRDEAEKEYVKHDYRRKSGSDKRERKFDKHDFRRYFDHRKDDRDKYKERDKDKPKERSKTSKEPTEKEADVNLKDFLICDSWSENDDKITSSSPNRDDSANVSVIKSPDKKDEGIKKLEKTDKIVINISKETTQNFKERAAKKVEVSEPIVDEPDKKPRVMEKLQPVIDCFKFEIDPNDDDIIDIYDGSSPEKYTEVKKKSSSFYVPPSKSSYEPAKDMSMDGMNDDTFLESVINEIRQDDDMSDETSQDKRLVEYDESPNKDDYGSPAVKGAKERVRASVTPELDEKMKEKRRHLLEFDKKESSKRNDYLDRKESSRPRSAYSEEKDQISERNDYSDRKQSGSQRSYYSDRKDTSSQRSNYSDGRQSTESGYKTSDTNKSDIKYDDNFRLSVEKELDEALERSMNRCTVESLETWSFVLKICQPLLFRHDKNKCFRETTVLPKIWYTENPKVCSCVKDRAIVYEELEMLKMGLVDRVYGCDQLADTPSVNARAWYPRAGACFAEGKVQPVAVDWEADDSQQGAAPEDRRRSPTPQRDDEIMLDREYQRFMEAVWPDVAEAKTSETSRSTTPVRQDARLKKKEEETEKEAEDKKPKKIKLSSEGWSQESDIEEEPEKVKKIKLKEKKSRKRKRSTSTLSSDSDSDGSAKKKRKMMKVKAIKKEKSKEAKRRRMGKKLLKKLKEKQKLKKKIDKEDSEELELEEVKKKDVKKKKKKEQKLKKKSGKRRRKASSTTDFTTTSSGSDSEDDLRPGKSKKRKRTEGKKKRRNKRKKSSSESHSEDLFDVNILNNIKTERLTDDEKCQKLMEFSPRIHHKPREIINVKELQNDFVGNNIHIKKEVEDPKEVREEKVEETKIEDKEDKEEEKVVEVEKEKPVEELNKNECEVVVSKIDNLDAVPLPVSPPVVAETEKVDVKAISVELSSNQPINIPEPQDTIASAVPARIVDESNLSQCSSQESVCSVKETSSYEKDESHLRPSSQNSNYSFNDVIASQSVLYHKTIETIVDSQEKYNEGYELEPGNYEMYEHLAMAYQSDVANLASRPDAAAGVVPQRIETVVRARARGEIKCDWRADHPSDAPPANRPSRWGLKPSEVNIVLTGGEQESTTAPPAPSEPLPQPVYRIQSLANRTEVAADYDEAYMDMYGASDRLQYGDCFATDAGSVAHVAPSPAITDLTLVMPASPVKVTPQDNRSTLDARIDQALRDAALREMVAAAKAEEEQKELPEKGILVTSVVGGGIRGGKRVSFADGYQPGQDSDLEQPPLKKRRKVRRGGRAGCAWPCPASHPDHVPLWDALPPPPPPPGDPPRACRLAAHRPDPSNILGGFMPPEPPPGLISF